MKEEISDLVKESLTEQEEDEIETEFDIEDLGMDDEESDETEDEMDDDNLEMDVEDEFELPLDLGGDDEDDMSFDDDEEVIDLTGEEDEEEILRVFSLMGPEDSITVTKDNEGNINLKDDETDKEYMIVQEGDDEYSEMEMDEEYDEESIEDIVSKVFDESYNEEELEEGDYSEEDELDEGSEEIMYEIEFDDEDEFEEINLEEGDYNSKKPRKVTTFRDFGNWYDDDDMEYDGDFNFDYDEEEFDDYESYKSKHPNHKTLGVERGYFDTYRRDYGPAIVRTPRGLDESKMTSKPKGVGMGKPKFKFDSKPNMGKGFNTKMKKGNPTMGTGKPKFEFKEGQGYDDKKDENLGMRKGKTSQKDLKGTHSKQEKSRRDDADFETRKKETKEASRTLGSGRRWGRKGLDKPKAAPRHLKVENTNTKEIQVLREKNEEYRKALNVFRNKLNEVAVFNSNLAYTTRLFTEHSTSKQEKINILRRFDGIETLKESKNLYQSIKNELSSGSVTKKTVNESIEKTLTKGSSANLIESKTYENPQFLRMKDLMAKLK
jgi:hypothetical protein